MKDTAIIFVTDGGYLAPSVLAAEQLLTRGVDASADILVFTVDVAPEVTSALRSRINNPSLTFVEMKGRDFLPPEGTPFFKNHVPTTSLARLSVEPEIPRRYRNLVYLDGDIQIVGDVTPLVTHRVPNGRIAAGRGSAWLDPQDEHSLEPPGYLHALGGVRKEDYFNAGVLAFNRETWVESAPIALARFFEKAEQFVRHDQSALNSVFKDRVDHLSPAYNFHAFYATAYVQNIVRPRIIHFTGSWKPWKTTTPPWGRRFHGGYLALLERHPELRDFLTVSQLPRTWPLKQPVEHLREAKRLLRERSDLRLRRALIRDHLARGDIAVH